MTKQTFIHGTLMLVAAGMTTRFLGFINRIVVARLMGEEGVGIYMMALPSLFLLLTLTQIGLPIAISKRVAEANAVADDKKIKQILALSILIITCTSIIFTIGMLFFTPIIANYFMTDVRTLYPLYAVCPVVPVVAFTSVIKGYFQGMQNMKPQSIAIIIEQIVRITAVYLLISWLLPYGLNYAATGAMVSVFFGEAASLLYLLFLFKRKKQVRIRRDFAASLKNSKKTRQDLLSIALPNTGSKLISSISNFLEPILVAQSLAISGVFIQDATRQYGELSGYVMPLLFLPSFITNSLSIALVPSISEAEANHDRALVHYRIHQAIRISFASGALATIIFTLFSNPILTYMYGTSNASSYIRLMAPFFLLFYIQAPLQSALFALDLAKQAMWNSLFGSIFKFIILFLLASNPRFGMMGVAIAICASAVLITLLHLAALRKAIRFAISLKDMTKMILLLGCTFLANQVLKKALASWVDQIFSFLCLLVILTLIYILLLFIFRFITKEELKQIPYLQKIFRD